MLLTSLFLDFLSRANTSVCLFSTNFAAGFAPKKSQSGLNKCNMSCGHKVGLNRFGTRELY